MNATYRYKRWLIGLGVLGAAMGVGFAVAGSSLLMTEPNPGSPPWAMAIVAVAAVLSTLLCGVGGPWIIAEVVRHRLTIDGDNVTQVLVFRTKRINLAEVVEARWRIGQDGGYLRLKTPDEKIKLEFYGYSRNETRRLVKFLRLRLPAAIQKGWEKYWAFTWRMFDVPDPARREEFAEKTRCLRRRLLVVLLLSSGVLVFMAVAVSFYARNVESLKQLVFLFLLLPIIYVVSAGRGKIAEHPDVRCSSDVSPLVLIGVIATMLIPCAAIPFAMLDMPITGRSVMIGGAALGCLLVIIGSWRRDRKTRQTQSLAAKLAEQEYMQPEPTRDSSGRSP
jgi:hypothetical protein